MSFDRKIDQVCPHEVINEALFLDDDRVTVRPLRPIAAISSLRLRYNGIQQVMPMGLRLPATANGTKRTPYTIKTGVNDKLVFVVDGGPEQTVISPAGAAVTARALAGELNRAISGAVFKVVNNKLQLCTASSGRKSTLFIKSASTISDVLGLPTNRVFRGRLPIPGFSVIRDPDTLADRPTRLVVFDEVMRGFADFVEISYTTIRQECRRCNGLGVENDWRWGTTGDTIEVRDEALLIQETMKIMFTVQGTNPFHAWYGTDLVNSTGKKLLAGGILQNFIVSDVQQAFRRWQQIKKQQEEDVGQAVSDREFPFRLSQVTLEQSDKDPTIVFVKATIQNRSGDPLELERGVQLPEPTDLLGATAQEGTVRRSLTDFQVVG